MVLLQFEKRTGTVLLCTVLRTTYQERASLKTMIGSSFSKREKKLHFFGLISAYSSQPLISDPKDTMIMSFQ